MIGTTSIQSETVCPQIMVDNLCPHCDPTLWSNPHFKPTLKLGYV